METIDVHTLKNKLSDDDTDEILIDVREPFEHKASTIPSATNVPLDELEEAIGTLKGVGRVYVHCNTGGRSSRACEVLISHGINVVNVEGGIEAWRQAGFPTAGSKKVIPIFRQVMIGAGTLVLIGMVLGWFFGPLWYAVPVFVGSGLLFGGVTGHCGMAALLKHMPWNT